MPVPQMLATFRTLLTCCSVLTEDRVQSLRLCNVAHLLDAGLATIVRDRDDLNEDAVCPASLLHPLRQAAALLLDPVVLNQWTQHKHRLDNYVGTNSCELMTCILMQCLNGSLNEFIEARENIWPGSAQHTQLDQAFTALFSLEARVTKSEAARLLSRLKAEVERAETLEEQRDEQRCFTSTEVVALKETLAQVERDVESLLHWQEMQIAAP